MASMIMNRTWAVSGKDKRSAAKQVNVICPIDFTERGTVALRYALQLARQRRGKLVVVHVLPESKEASNQEGAREIACESALVRLERFVPSLPGVRCEWVVLQGDVADQIVELAASCAVPQIVMAARDRNGYHRTLLGQTAEKVLRQAPCPVVIVTNEDIAPAGRSEHAVDRYCYASA